MNESTISCDVLMDQDNFSKKDFRVYHGWKIMYFSASSRASLKTIDGCKYVTVSSTGVFEPWTIQRVEDLESGTQLRREVAARTLNSLSATNMQTNVSRILGIQIYSC